MSNSKYIKYYINGKEVDKKIITQRKGKLTNTTTVVKKHYEAPLTIEEKKERDVAAKNSAKFFQNMRDMREDSEKYHGG